MKVIKARQNLEEIKEGCVLTIGNFDGVHIGHQKILSEAKQVSVRAKTELVVMTFEPHPLSVLYPDEAPGILTPFALKQQLIEEFGADCLLVVESTTQLLSLSARDFVERFLVENIQPSIVVEGDSFNFGSGRTGRVDILQQLGEKNGFDVLVVETGHVTLSNGKTVKVSSTVIRELLKAGRIADAAVALGRPYRLAEKVIPGRGKGKNLGFPTANIKLPRQIVPAEGVYAGFAEVADSLNELFSADRSLPAVFSIGRAESLTSGHPLLIETHLMVQNVGDLLGRYLAMDFVEKIRDQLKFETEPALSNQIAKDCIKAKEILSECRSV